MRLRVFVHCLALSSSAQETEIGSARAQVQYWHLEVRGPRRNGLSIVLKSTHDCLSSRPKEDRCWFNFVTKLHGKLCILGFMFGVRLPLGQAFLRPYQSHHSETTKTLQDGAMAPKTTDKTLGRVDETCQAHKTSENPWAMLDPNDHTLGKEVGPCTNQDSLQKCQPPIISGKHPLCLQHPNRSRSNTTTCIKYSGQPRRPPTPTPSPSMNATAHDSP